ncbi:MAG: permease [Lachnospiraceae bacterium]|nr:permease [Lachnospiraceae bacterium]
MNAILIMKGLSVIGIILCVVLMIWKQGQLAKTPEGQANIKWGLQPKNLIATAIVGVVANFFDTLGIGSFAPSSSAFKLTKSVDDLLVPGTLNVGDTVPVCIEAFLFFDAFNIDPMTCVLMCVAATVGAFLGASIVSKWDRTKVRWGFGIGLIVLAIIMLCKWGGWGPFGIANVEYTADHIGQVVDGRIIADVNGDIAAVGLVGGKLILACVINFLLGAAMCLGVGLYAPCMALCVLIGLHTGMAFPIMMGSCAYLMAFGNGPKFIMEGRYDVIACWTQAIGGAIGVFLAYYVVKSMDLKTLTILVVVVCFITGLLYLKDAIAGSKA